MALVLHITVARATRTGRDGREHGERSDAPGQRQVFAAGLLEGMAGSS
jgi:hypothetical protein